MSFGKSLGAAAVLSAAIAMVTLPVNTAYSAEAGAKASGVTHGLAMHGTLKYPPDFKHFDYVNPNAPKGGAVRLAATGGFDSFNPYIVRGRDAAGVGLIYESLTVSSKDEAFSA